MTEWTALGSAQGRFCFAVATETGSVPEFGELRIKSSALEPIEISETMERSTRQF